MKSLYSNSFIKLDSFYDQRIEVTLSESIQGFSTKDFYIQQKGIFIISYIYQKTMVKEIVVIVSGKFCLQLLLVESFVCYRFINLVESYVYCALVKLYFLELYLKTFF